MVDTKHVYARYCTLYSACIVDMGFSARATTVYYFLSVILNFAETLSDFRLSQRGKFRIFLGELPGNSAALEQNFAKKY